MLTKDRVLLIRRFVMFHLGKFSVLPPGYDIFCLPSVGKTFFTKITIFMLSKAIHFFFKRQIFAEKRFLRSFYHVYLHSTANFPPFSEFFLKNEFFPKNINFLFFKKTHFRTFSTSLTFYFIVGQVCFTLFTRNFQA